MWNSPVVKMMRWLVYIPIVFLVLTFMHFLFGLLFIGIAKLNLSIFWLIVALFFLGGLLWNIFKTIALLIAMLAKKVCPNEVFGGYILAGMTSIYFLYTLFKLWTIQPEFTGTIVVICLIISILILELGFNLIMGSFMTSDE
jgi:hypothetical protein